MPIPEFINGMLPEGVWDCSLAEIEARFSGFDRTAARRELFANLKAYFEEARGVGLIRAVFVDGSFVTDKPEPGDVDLIVVRANDKEAAEDLKTFEYNTVSRRMITRLHKLDAAVVFEGSEKEAEYFDLFTMIRGEEVRKGILRIVL